VREVLLASRYENLVVHSRLETDITQSRNNETQALRLPAPPFPPVSIRSCSHLDNINPTPLPHTMLHRFILSASYELIQLWTIHRINCETSEGAWGVAAGEERRVDHDC
jgi:hypothetical protein